MENKGQRLVFFVGCMGMLASIIFLILVLIGFMILMYLGICPIVDRIIWVRDPDVDECGRNVGVFGVYSEWQYVDILYYRVRGGNS